jgi:pimeloyl-ACP methyl ester carboxylesterase
MAVLSSTGRPGRYHLVAPDYPGFGQSDAPDPARFGYTFDHLAAIIGAFTEAIGLKQYTLYMQDYGGPIGWQEWLRVHQPRLLVVWGKYDPSFTVAGAEAYKRDVPGAQVNLLDAGHFALDEANDEIASLILAFLGKR